MLTAAPPYPLTVTLARKAGRIDAECKKAGMVIAFQDLVIGATALQFGYSVLTLNIRHFEMVPDLEVRQI